MKLNKQIKILISKYIDNETTREERERVEKMLSTSNELKSYLEEQEKLSDVLSTWQEEEISFDLKKKIHNISNRHIQKPEPSSNLMSYSRLAGMLMILIVVSVSIKTFNQHHNRLETETKSFSKTHSIVASKTPELTKHSNLLDSRSDSLHKQTKNQRSHEVSTEILKEEVTDGISSRSENLVPFTFQNSAKRIQSDSVNVQKRAASSQPINGLKIIPVDKNDNILVSHDIIGKQEDPQRIGTSETESKDEVISTVYSENISFEVFVKYDPWIHENLETIFNQKKLTYLDNIKLHDMINYLLPAFSKPQEPYFSFVILPSFDKTAASNKRIILFQFLTKDKLMNKDQLNISFNQQNLESIRILEFPQFSIDTLEFHPSFENGFALIFEIRTLKNSPNITETIIDQVKLNDITIPFKGGLLRATEQEMLISYIAEYLKIRSESNLSESDMSDKINGASRDIRLFIPRENNRMKAFLEILNTYDNNFK